jgi:hypothetical protein
VTEKASLIILLCEDELHARLVRAYMKECGLEQQERYVRALVASRMQHGGNIDWVLRAFPGQLHACRQRQKKARTLLVVVADADKFTVEDRRRHLNDRLKEEGYEELKPEDPVVVLIPRYHVETWINALLGNAVAEGDDCKDWKKATKEEVRRAARTAYEWARPNATPGPTCLPSLRSALSEWRKLS